jgi:hypothetical protein
VEGNEQALWQKSNRICPRMAMEKIVVTVGQGQHLRRLMKMRKMKL